MLIITTSLLRLTEISHLTKTNPVKTFEFFVPLVRFLPTHQKLFVFFVAGSSCPVWSFHSFLLSVMLVSVECVILEIKTVQLRKNTS